MLFSQRSVKNTLSGGKMLLQSLSGLHRWCSDVDGWLRLQTGDGVVWWTRCLSLFYRGQAAACGRSGHV